jgi:hypothetical protein
MSSSKRHRVDSSPSGSDVEVERRSASDRGKEGRIESVGYGKHGDVRIMVSGNAHVVNNVIVVKEGGARVNLDSLRRDQRRQKKRKRESGSKEPVSAEKRENGSWTVAKRQGLEGRRRGPRSYPSQATGAMQEGQAGTRTLSSHVRGEGGPARIHTIGITWTQRRRCRQVFSRMLPHPPSGIQSMIPRSPLMNSSTRRAKKTSSLKPCLTARWVGRPQLRPECQARLPATLQASISL